MAWSHRTKSGPPFRNAAHDERAHALTVPVPSPPPPPPPLARLSPPEPYRRAATSSYFPPPPPTPPPRCHVLRLHHRSRLRRRRPHYSCPQGRRHPCRRTCQAPGRHPFRSQYRVDFSFLVMWNPNWDCHLLRSSPTSMARSRGTGTTAPAGRVRFRFCCTSN